MRALAKFILRGPLQAILIAVLFALLQLVLTLVPVSLLSAATIGLVTLQIGWRQGLLVAAGTAICTGLLVLVLSRGSGATAHIVVLGFAVMLWLPTWLLGGVLRSTRSLSLMLQAGVLLGILLVVAAFLLLGDPAKVYVQFMDQARTAMTQAAAGTDEASVVQALYEQIKSWTPYLTGILAGAMAMNAVVAVIFARAAQAALYNPSALRAEFNMLRCDRTTAIITLTILALAMITRTAVIENIAGVLLVVDMFYGLAVVHGAIAKRRAGIGWLVVVYLAMVVFALPMTVLLTALGLVDTWADVRSRIVPKGAS